MIRARDGLNVNIHLVAVGAAAPYFYRGRRGMFAARLETLALRANGCISVCGMRVRARANNPDVGVDTLGRAFQATMARCLGLGRTVRRPR